MRAYHLQPCGLPVPLLPRQKELEITMIFQTEEGFCFFNPVKKGAEDAAAMNSAHVDFQYAAGEGLVGQA